MNVRQPAMSPLPRHMAALYRQLRARRQVFTLRQRRGLGAGPAIRPGAGARSCRWNARREPAHGGLPGRAGLAGQLRGRAELPTRWLRAVAPAKWPLTVVGVRGAIGFGAPGLLECSWRFRKRV